MKVIARCWSLRISWAVAAVAPGLLAAAAPVQAEVRVLNAVVAAIDGRPLTMADLERFANTSAKLLPPGERGSLEAVLRAMIEQELFEAEFQAQGIFVDEDDVNDYIDRLLSQGGSSREDVKGALAEIGLSWDDYFARMRIEVQKLTLMNREIRSRANVTPEEVERYWEDDDRFVRGGGVEIGQIFIPLPAERSPAADELVRRRAEEAHALAEDDFAAAAQQYSMGPSAAEGGIIGVFERGSMGLLFEREVAKLGDGEVSRPFEAGNGIHILKRVRSVEGGRVPLEEVEEEIRARLYDEMLAQRYANWVDEELWKRHHVVEQLVTPSELLERSDLDPS